MSELSEYCLQEEYADGTVKTTLVMQEETDLYTIRMYSRNYLDYRKASEKPERDNTLKNHPLTGKKLRDVETGDIYTIQSVHRQYYFGWYVSFLLERNSSHMMIMWQNESCSSKTMVDIIEQIRTEYEFA